MEKCWAQDPKSRPNFDLIVTELDRIIQPNKEMKYELKLKQVAFLEKETGVRKAIEKLNASPSCYPHVKDCCIVKSASITSGNPWFLLRYVTESGKWESVNNDIGEFELLPVRPFLIVSFLVDEKSVNVALEKLNANPSPYPNVHGYCIVKSASIVDDNPLFLLQENSDTHLWASVDSNLSEVVLNPIQPSTQVV